MSSWNCHFPELYFYNSLPQVCGRLQKKLFFFFLSVELFKETFENNKGHIQSAITRYYSFLLGTSANWLFFYGNSLCKKIKKNKKRKEADVCCQRVVSLLQNYNSHSNRRGRIMSSESGIMLGLVSKPFLCAVICSWLADSWEDLQLSAQTFSSLLSLAGSRLRRLPSQTECNWLSF